MSRARDYESYEDWKADNSAAAHALESAVVEETKHQGHSKRALDRRIQEKFGEMVISEMIEDGDAYRSEMGAIFLTEQGKRKGVTR